MTQPGTSLNKYVLLCVAKRSLFHRFHRHPTNAKDFVASIKAEITWNPNLLHKSAWQDNTFHRFVDESQSLVRPRFMDAQRKRKILCDVIQRYCVNWNKSIVIDNYHVLFAYVGNALNHQRHVDSDWEACKSGLIIRCHNMISISKVCIDFNRFCLIYFY